MHSNNLRGRSDLANFLGLSRTTIYTAFNSDWSGVATTTVLAQVAGQFGVPLSRLVVEPAVSGRRVRTSERRT